MAKYQYKHSILKENTLSKNDKLHKIALFNNSNQLRKQKEKDEKFEKNEKYEKNDLIKEVFLVSANKNNLDLSLNLKALVYFQNGNKATFFLKRKKDQSMEIHNFLVSSKIGQANYEENYRILNNKIDNFFATNHKTNSKKRKENNNGLFIDNNCSFSSSFESINLKKDLNKLHKNSTPNFNKEDLQKTNYEYINNNFTINNTTNKLFKNQRDTNKKTPNMKNNCGKIKRQFELNNNRSYFTPIKEMSNIRDIYEIKTQKYNHEIIYNKNKTLNSNRCLPISKVDNNLNQNNQLYKNINSKDFTMELNKSSRMEASNEKNNFFDKSDTIQFDSSANHFKKNFKSELNTFSSENIIQEEEIFDKKISSFPVIKPYFSPYLEDSFCQNNNNNNNNQYNIITFSQDENDTPHSNYIIEQKEKRTFPLNNESNENFVKLRKNQKENPIKYNNFGNKINPSLFNNNYKITNNSQFENKSDSYENINEYQEKEIIPLNATFEYIFSLLNYSKKRKNI